MVYVSIIHEYMMNMSLIFSVVAFLFDDKLGRCHFFLAIVVSFVKQRSIGGYDTEDK